MNVDSRNNTPRAAPVVTWPRVASRGALACMVPHSPLLAATPSTDDFCEITPRLRRYYAEITPRLRRDYAEITSRLRRDYANITLRSHRDRAEIVPRSCRDYAEIAPAGVAAQQRHRHHQASTCQRPARSEPRRMSSPLKPNLRDHAEITPRSRRDHAECHLH